jgi:DNA-directed RNA polymerase specialized sigma24 family protein
VTPAKRRPRSILRFLAKDKLDSAPAAMNLPRDALIRVARIKSVVSQWDQFSRQVFILRKVYSFSHAEIAARTGMSDDEVLDCLVNIALRLAKSPWLTDVSF